MYKTLQYIEQDKDVLAAILIGSRARDTADEYSDLDVIVVTNSPGKYLAADEWLTDIGPYHISFIEGAFLEGKTRRILFDDGLDIDWIVLTPAQAKNIHEIGGQLARGYRVLKDELGIAAVLHAIKIETPILAESEFQNLVNDFWFHSVWTAKKLMRGEWFTAKSCLDVYMKRLLLTLIEVRACLHGGNDIWYNGRFIEQWADPWVLNRLAAAYATYDATEIARALLANMDFFAALAVELSRQLNFTYPKEAETQAHQLLRKLLNGNISGIS